MFCIKIKTLPSVTLFSRLNIKLKHNNMVKRTKNYDSNLITSCFRQYLDKKVGTSCPELLTNS